MLAGRGLSVGALATSRGAGPVSGAGEELLGESQALRCEVSSRRRTAGLASRHLDRRDGQQGLAVAALCVVGVHFGAGHRPIASRERKIGNSARTRRSISSLTWRGT